jgi:choline-sulfatase
VSRSRFYGACLLITLLAQAGACSRQEEGIREPGQDPACTPLTRSRPPERRDLVLVVSDTMRRDRIGIYGGSALTPSFDALASSGLVFTAAETQAPWTKPSIATLFTGLMPSHHGVVSHPLLRRDTGTLLSDILLDEHTTLAESLTAEGYETAAFVSNPWIQKRLGFGQGFQTWDESMAANATPGERVTAAGLRWLRERPDDARPFFLYLHYMDAHAPYHPVPEAKLLDHKATIRRDERPSHPAARPQIRRIAMDAIRGSRVARGIEPNQALMELVYDGGVEHFDRALGQLLDGLKQREDWHDLALIVTSDHGEALFERGWGEHGDGLYEEETAVPLIAKLPGIETRGAFACPVGLIDLGATLCDYLGVSCGEKNQGTSLLSPAIGDENRKVLVEGVKQRPGNRAVRSGRYKLIFEPDGHVAPRPGGSVRLFDLSDDPDEVNDLLRHQLSEVHREVYERLLETASETAIGARGTSTSVELDEVTTRRLEALGYIESDE